MEITNEGDDNTIHVDGGSRESSEKHNRLRKIRAAVDGNKRNVRIRSRLRGTKITTSEKQKEVPPHMISIPDGFVSGDLTSDIISAFLSNILYMKQLLIVPTFSQLVDELTSNELKANCSTEVEGLPTRRLKRKRSTNSSDKVAKDLLNLVTDLGALCRSNDVQKFAVFFGPSYSVPKQCYILEFPLKPHGEDSNVACKKDSTIRGLMRSLVMYWSGSQLASNANVKSMFVGVQMNPVCGGHSNTNGNVYPPSFVYRSDYNLLLRRKKRLFQARFILKSKNSIDVGEEIYDKGGEDWLLLKKVIKIKSK